MFHCDVVYEFLYEHRLAHACAAEQAYLAALGVRFHKVDDLYARFEHLCHGALVLEGGSLAVYGPLFFRGGGGLAVDGVAQNVEHSAQGAGADGYVDYVARGGDFRAASKAFARAEHYAAHGIGADVLRNFHYQLFAAHLYGERVLYFRQFAFEPDVRYGTGYMNYSTLVHFKPLLLSF